MAFTCDIPLPYSATRRGTFARVVGFSAQDRPNRAPQLTARVLVWESKAEHDAGAGPCAERQVSVAVTAAVRTRLAPIIGDLENAVANRLEDADTGREPAL
jgi:hypothetical protein